LGTGHFDGEGRGRRKISTHDRHGAEKSRAIAAEAQWAYRPLPPRRRIGATGPGDIVGEMSLIERRAPSVSVAAASD
jgi:hypothetical protein